MIALPTSSTRVFLLAFTWQCDPGCTKEVSDLGRASEQFFSALVNLRIMIHEVMISLRRHVLKEKKRQEWIYSLKLSLINSF